MDAIRLFDEGKVCVIVMSYYITDVLECGFRHGNVESDYAKN